VPQTRNGPNEHVQGGALPMSLDVPYENDIVLWSRRRFSAASVKCIAFGTMVRFTQGRAGHTPLKVL
jgi:hypothetical protein